MFAGIRDVRDARAAEKLPDLRAQFRALLSGAHVHNRRAIHENGAENIEPDQTPNRQ